MRISFSWGDEASSLNIATIGHGKNYRQRARIILIVLVEDATYIFLPPQIVDEEVYRRLKNGASRRME